MNQDREMKFTDYVVLSSTIFALFFGAGNLIFPLHLGQLAGKNWLFATIGFILISVLLPLLAILAIALTRSKGVYDIAIPLGHTFALIFMVLIQSTIGPFFAVPRTASISYTVSMAPFIPRQYQQIASIIYVVGFFAVCFYIAYNQNGILDKLGKILNPIFLVLLFLVFLVAFIKPMGNPNLMSANKAYLNPGNAVLNGVLEGYNTMDALAGLAFGVTIVSVIRSMGKKESKAVAVAAMRSGTMGMATIGVIYLLLIMLGAMSLGKLHISADGGLAFVQIVQSYAGYAGQAMLAALMTLTCLTTAAGLLIAFSQDFHQHFPKLSYHAWLAISTGISIIIGNFGLISIIAWSKPILMLLYPVSIALIFLALLAPTFKNDRIVFILSVIGAGVPALLDMVAALPPVALNTPWAQAIVKVRNFLPFATQGMDWIIPMVSCFILGLIVHFIKQSMIKIKAQ